VVEAAEVVALAVVGNAVAVVAKVAEAEAALAAGSAAGAEVVGAPTWNVAAVAVDLAVGFRPRPPQAVCSAKAQRWALMAARVAAKWPVDRTAAWERDLAWEPEA
jgi:hypothetical protein